MLELAVAARLPIAPHEAERQAEVHQLDGRQELVRCLPHLSKLIEELIRASRVGCKAFTSAGCAQPLAAPQGVLSTTSSMLAHSA